MKRQLFVGGAFAGLSLTGAFARPSKLLAANVTFEPGATATTAMTHIAIVEKLDGKSSDWMEHVSNEQYQA